MVRHRLLPALALLPFVSACSRCSGPSADVELFVPDVPLTVKAAEKLHDPPQYDVTVTKRSVKHGGGGGCGHSPLCIILIPVIIGDAILPEQAYTATINKDGKDWFVGSYASNKRFISGSFQRAGYVSRVQRVLLKAVDRHLIVELDRLPTAGAKTPPTPVSLQDQLDLVTAYADLITDPKSKRWNDAKLSKATRLPQTVREGLFYIGDPIVPAVTKMLSAKPVTDGADTAVARELCQTHGNPTAGGAFRSRTWRLLKPASRKKLMALIETSPYAETLKWAVRCHVGQTSFDRVAGKAVLRQLIEYSCKPTKLPNTSDLGLLISEIDDGIANKTWKRTKSKLNPAASQLRAATIANLDACGDPGMKALYEIQLRASLTKKSVLPAVTEQRAWIRVAAADMLARDDDPLAYELLAEPKADAATLLRRLRKSEQFSDEQLSALIGAAAIHTTPRARAELLATLDESSNDPKQLLQLLAGVGRDARPPGLAALRAGLGDARSRGPLLKLLRECDKLRPKPKTEPGPSAVGAPSSSAPLASGSAATLTSASPSASVAAGAGVSAQQKPIRDARDPRCAYLGHVVRPERVYSDAELAWFALGQTGCDHKAIEAAVRSTAPLTCQ